MIIGPDVAALREAAKRVVMLHYVSVAEVDAVPATLRAMYVLKAQEAERVLAGGSSPLIEREAALRGYTPYQMARVVAFMASDSVDVEILRTEANVLIEAAATPAAVLAVLADLGLSLRVAPDGGSLPPYPTG